MNIHPQQIERKVYSTFNHLEDITDYEKYTTKKDNEPNANYDPLKYIDNRQYNRNNSNGSDYEKKTKDSLKGFNSGVSGNNPRESPKSYTTKIKSLVDNLGSGYNVAKGKHVFLEYINKDNIQPHSGVFFNVKYDNFANTPTETRFGQYKDIYNINTDDGITRNDGSNSNRIYDYSHHNDMKYNGPKRDDFSNKLGRKDESSGISSTKDDIKSKDCKTTTEQPSDVHFKFNNNYVVNTDDRDKHLGSSSSHQKSTYIKTKLEKYYTKGVKDTTVYKEKDQSPSKYTTKDYPSYSLTYKAKNLEKTLSKGTFSSTMQKLKK
jgi:hypothetical protein